MKEAITDDVVVTRIAMPELGLYGLATMQVCAYGEVPPERVEARANELNPASPDGHLTWKILWGDDESDPINNANKGPVPCAEDLARLHYLLSC